jgi:hypothetical protein
MEVQCGSSFEMVPVISLLFGMHGHKHKEIFKRIEELERSVKGVVTAESAELRAMAQREFSKLFRIEQSKQENYCPNVFTLLPADGRGWRDKLAGQKMHLQLFCTQPGEWHPEGKPYTIKQPPERLFEISPLVNAAAKILKYAAPIAGSWVDIKFPDFAKEYEDQLKLMEELIEKLPENERSRDSELAESMGEHKHSEFTMGVSLRALRHLLDEIDAKQVWGGLRKIQTPEGDHLWLCEHHAKQYRV